MDVREIVEEYLKANGYDGLYSEGCGCQASDLMPCDMPCEDCQPGYKVPCDPKTCPAYGDCEWHIEPKQLHIRNDKAETLKKGGRLCEIKNTIAAGTDTKQVINEQKGFCYKFHARPAAVLT